MYRILNKNNNQFGWERRRAKSGWKLLRPGPGAVELTRINMKWSVAHKDKRRRSEIIRGRWSWIKPKTFLFSHLSISGHSQAYTLNNRLKEIGETEQMQTGEVDLYSNSKETRGKVQQSGRKLSNWIYK